MLAEDRIDCRCKHGEIGHLVYDSWAYGQSAMIEKFNQTKQDELMQGCDENEILYENKYSSVAWANRFNSRLNLFLMQANIARDFNAYRRNSNAKKKRVDIKCIFAVVLDFSIDFTCSRCHLARLVHDLRH